MTQGPALLCQVGEMRFSVNFRDQMQELNTKDR